MTAKEILSNNNVVTPPKPQSIIRYITNAKDIVIHDSGYHLKNNNIMYAEVLKSSVLYQKIKDQHYRNSYVVELEDLQIYNMLEFMKVVT